LRLSHLNAAARFVKRRVPATAAPVWVSSGALAGAMIAVTAMATAASSICPNTL